MSTSFDRRRREGREKTSRPDKGKKASLPQPPWGVGEGADELLGKVSRRRGGRRRRCFESHAHPGARRHAVRAALIGSAGESRPLSCSRAGFGVAAIFVDVSAPRGC